jgi:UDP-glucose 4-epimerase
LIADPSKLIAELGWLPQHASLPEIINSALEWERRLNS